MFTMLKKKAMSVTISVRLPNFTARQLEALARRTHRSKDELIVEGLEHLFADALEQKSATLRNEDFDALLDFIEQPLPAHEMQKLRKLMSKPYVRAAPKPLRRLCPDRPPDGKPKARKTHEPAQEGLCRGVLSAAVICGFRYARRAPKGAPSSLEKPSVAQKRSGSTASN